MTDTDVLIVGAGPTGLMLACQLARRGVRVVIVDRNAGPVRETRALGVQARTLEIYAQLGIVGQALALGTPGGGANLWAGGRRRAWLALGAAGRALSAYPYILILGQDDNERLLGARLAELGVDVQWRSELVALDAQADGVTATLRAADGSTRTLTAAWVGGCDGAHSRVRELNRIAFDGAPYEHVFYVADTVARGRMVAGEVNVFLRRDGFHLLFPMRGADHWRIVGILPPALRERRDTGFAELLPTLQQDAGAGLAVESCSWFSTYRIHHRAAAHFRAGRCFLLGDAAHIHSPVGAQGMNTGLQDAYNLAWKLALVIQNGAGAALLDSYAAEREPVAQRLLATTDRAFRFIVADGWLAGWLRTQVLVRVAGWLLRNERLQRLAFRTVSQIGIDYRDGPLSVTASDLPATAGVRGGDRFPWLRLRLRGDGPVEDLYAALDDTRFTLLVIGQPLSMHGELPLPQERMQMFLVPADADNSAVLGGAGVPWPSYWLLRPDGHVGACGGRWDAAAVAGYAAMHLQLRD